MDTTRAWYLVIGAALTCCAILWQRIRSRPKLPLPPGPPKLPLLGNLLDMPAERQWETFEQWNKELKSDIIHLNVAGTSVVVLSSFRAVDELFERRSLLYSDRLGSTMLVELMGWDFALPYMKYGDVWREHRKLFHSAFNNEAARQFHPQERLIARALLHRLVQNPDNVLKELRHMMGTLIMDVTYGIKAHAADDPFINLAEAAMQGIFAAAIPGSFLVDMLPILKYVPSWVPGAGFQRKAQQWKKLTRAVLEEPFAEAKRNLAEGKANPSFTTLSLHNLDESKGLDSTEKQAQESLIMNTAANMYASAADTTVATLGFFFLAMLDNADVQRKAQAEIDAVVGSGNLPDFVDREALPYVSAVLKEVLRWRTIAPIAVPHYMVAEDEYRGYRIPAGSIVIGNTWALHHDENTYPDPFSFKPERFLLNGKLNPAVRDPEPAAFGFGRRVCPGQAMAMDALWITISTILAALHIAKAVDGHGNPIEPSHECAPGLLSAPLPFKCSITPRSSRAADLIREAGFNEG